MKEVKIIIDDISKSEILYFVVDEFSYRMLGEYIDRFDDKFNCDVLRVNINVDFIGMDDKILKGENLVKVFLSVEWCD